MRERKKHIVTQRVAMLRIKNGFDQKRFADELSQIANTDKEIKQSNVSGWETGRRPIPLKYLGAIADLFGVSQAYLLGEGNNPYTEDKDLTALKDEKYEIPMTKLYAYDKLPVFVSFDQVVHEPGWAIYDRTGSRFVFADDYVTEVAFNKVGGKVYTQDPRMADIMLNNLRSLDMSKLLSREQVYVSMMTMDTFTRGVYNGWYKHNEDHSMLINARGNTLPYHGLNVAYKAYSYMSNDDYE